MFSGIGKRVTYANVAMTLALVFAMSGGAWAAGKYVITSTKQISPKVLKSLQGKAGAQGAQGATGPAGSVGPAGSTGAAGPKGETGAAGANGTDGVPGKNGENGKEGSPWTAGGTLPPKATETGAWGFSSPKEEEEVQFTISFPIRLKEPLNSEHVFYVEEAGNGTTCPGTSENPAATPGNLCVYEGKGESLEFGGPLGIAVVHIFNPAKRLGIIGGEGAGATGAGLIFKKGKTSNGGPPEPEASLAAGTWAVTAP